MAAALDSATGLADGLRRKGFAPTVVMLTDGRANISRDGKPGRERAELDALRVGAEAARFQTCGIGGGHLAAAAWFC